MYLKEHGALFFETSSKESKYVIETMEAIARILQEKEDKQIEDVLNLRVKEKKKGCCS
jgi:ribulose-5-phosphate 4-epimerase/fuculose-1-phosphate aldolase